MHNALPQIGLQVRSLYCANGELELSLASVPLPTPAADEVLVRIDATPINPSDLRLLFGAADMSTVKRSGSDEQPIITARVPPHAMSSMAARADESMPVGNEGAGLVVAAGSSPAAQQLLGRIVGMHGGAMYAQYRCINAVDCLPVPIDITALEAASSYVNPLTALCMIEAMRREGHRALVHTAAASNVGQMLNRLCIHDHIDLVNIVRKPAQVQRLREVGAKYVCDSSANSFLDDLTDALVATGATLAFDAIGGGDLAAKILHCMEAAISRSAQLAGRSTGYHRYGTTTLKQVYIYGNLDRRPTEIERSFGLSWRVGGWLMSTALQELGDDTQQRLKARVAAELKTTFVSHYVDKISLLDLLNPEMIDRYSRHATGEKYVIEPNRVNKA